MYPRPNREPTPTRPNREPEQTAAGIWWFSGGLVLCGLGTIWLGTQQTAKGGTKADECRSHLSQLAVATSIYLSDSDGVLPIENWYDGIVCYAKDPYAFSCPVLHRGGLHGGYVLNKLVAGKPIASFRDLTRSLLFFETSKAKLNVIDYPTTMLPIPRHGVLGVAYLDGKASFLPERSDK